MSVEHLDVLIIGAGLSGIGAAYHLMKHCPGKRFAILEGREALGGTWDLFRYPGIRSDSDMFTLGYNFKPWTNPLAIADGPSIRSYIAETAEENGIQQHIRFQHKVLKADWCSERATWTLQVQRGDEPEPFKLSCQHLLMCTGYYRYEAGYTPDFKGRELFQGEFIHPQLWPENFDYSGKNVVVIGSGATAVTLVPAMADKAKHVTMLQRSPTYVVSLPQGDPISDVLRKFLPETWVYRLARTRNVAVQLGFYKLSKAFPNLVRKALLGLARHQLGKGFDMRHFSPRYKPWDERVCAVPNGDLFKVLRQGKASVVTDHIAEIDEAGIQLQSGDRLDCDVIVTATGFDLSVMGEIPFTVDEQAVNFAETVSYRGTMFTGVPNMAWVYGYGRYSWTLRAELIGTFVCNLLNHMDAKGVSRVDVALRDEDQGMELLPWIESDNFNPGYLVRGLDQMPRRGDKPEWRHNQDYWAEKDEIPKTDLEGSEFVYDGVRAGSKAKEPVAA